LKVLNNDLKALTAQPVAAHRVAKIVSVITNPCILSIVMLLFIAFTKSNGLGEASAEAAVLIGLFVILPLIYIFLRTAGLPDKKLYRTDPTLFLKRHPLDILILGVVCGPFSWAILKFLSAPAPMLDTLVALLAVACVIALIYHFYRISFHLAAISTLAYMAVATWGVWLLILLAVIPLIAWAKHELHEHDTLQMVLGVGLAVVITSVTYHLL
jgi:hypothetical protein